MITSAYNPMREFHPSLTSVAAAVHDGFVAWRRRSREREALAMMGERELHDIGMSRGDAQFEPDKPFWRQ